MPCNMLGTVTARLTVNVKDLNTDDAKVLAAIKVVVAKAVAVNTEQVNVYKTWNGLTIEVGNYTYELDVNGVLAVRSPNRSAEVNLKKIGQALAQLQGLITQQKVRAALALRFRVAQQQMTPQGAVVMELEV